MLHKIGEVTRIDVVKPEEETEKPGKEEDK